MNTITQQLAALRTATVNELAAKYAELVGKPPRVKNRKFLERQVAWHLQARELGGLPARATARLNELVAQIDLPLAAAPPPKLRPHLARTETRAPMIGTTIVRRWHAQDLRVEVRENGYEWNGVVYKSLSAVAKAITGANWNGPLFFGLTHRRAAQ